MKKEDYHTSNSITDAHQKLGLPKPKHPLISFISRESNPIRPNALAGTHVLNFYKISYKPKLSGSLKYGQDYYDFDEGGLVFASPNQLVGGHDDDDISAAACSHAVLLLHPDFLLGYPLAKTIKQYGFFSYAVHEALHLSESEKATIFSVFKLIEEELNSRIDDFSQDVIIAQIELLLNYSQRFYKRQFITRKAVNSTFLQKLEDVTDNYFRSENPLQKGLPTVHYLAEQLAISPSYLSDLLRSLIGQNTQQYIHNKLIDKAKEKLSTTTLSVSEIAYELGFEHSQSFSKLFKSKTNQSPLEFRASFN